MTTRIKELPSAAGDIERQLNGASFAVRTTLKPGYIRHVYYYESQVYKTKLSASQG